MRSVWHELSRIGGWGEGVCVSNERGRRRKYTPEQGKSKFASQQHMHCLFSFSLSLSFFSLSFAKGIRK